jgi:hypothetical protein
MPAAAFAATGDAEALELGKPGEDHRNVALAIGALIMWGTGPSYPKLAAKRMEEVLTNMKVGTRPESEWAWPVWARNAKEVRGADPRAAIVTFVIEGKTFKAFVPEAMPIRWAE